MQIRYKNTPLENKNFLNNQNYVIWEKKELDILIEYYKENLIKLFFLEKTTIWYIIIPILFSIFLSLFLLSLSTWFILFYFISLRINKVGIFKKENNIFHIIILWFMLLWFILWFIRYKINSNVETFNNIVWSILWIVLLIYALYFVLLFSLFIWFLYKQIIKLILHFSEINFNVVIVNPESGGYGFRYK